ncbi:ribosome silencing factor [Virgibacillus kimchii]
MEKEKILQLAADACDGKKAEDVMALNMNEVSLVADYFLICHGNTERQVQAIARGVKETMEENDIQVNRMEGFEQARWVLVDIGDIVCHIFHKDERRYYNLERLWGDADQVALTLSGE